MQVAHQKTEAIHPRNETPLHMIHTFLCPLLKARSFTLLICVFDIAFYVLALVLSKSSRPLQPTIFELGQLYPAYVKQQPWRLLFSLELHSDELHLLVSIALKLNILSYAEYLMGTRRLVLLYFLSGLSATLGQSILLPKPGVCGNFHVGIILLVLILQAQMLERSSLQQQLVHYFDYQQSQNLTLQFLRFLFFMLSALYFTLRNQYVLFEGAIFFGIQSVLIGISFEDSLFPGQKPLQFQEQQAKSKQTVFLWLAFLVFFLEVLVFWALVEPKMV